MAVTQHLRALMQVAFTQQVFFFAVSCFSNLQLMVVVNKHNRNWPGDSSSHPGRCCIARCFGTICLNMKANTVKMWNFVDKIFYVQIVSLTGDWAIVLAKLLFINPLTHILMVSLTSLFTYSSAYKSLIYTLFFCLFFGFFFNFVHIHPTVPVGIGSMTLKLAKKWYK